MLHAGHEKVFKKKKYLSDTKYDVRTSSMTFCQTCHRCVCLRQLSKNLFIFVRPIIVKTKVHFKILELLVITFDTER